MSQQPSARLLRAYRQTLYRVGCVEVRIGARSSAARSLLQRERVRTAVVITAWNPMSRRMPGGWNERAQRSLLQRLRRTRVLLADGHWRAWREAHVLVPGVPAPLIVLARRYRQRAVVLLRPDGSARLVLVAAANLLS